MVRAWIVGCALRPWQEPQTGSDFGSGAVRVRPRARRDLPARRLECRVSTRVGLRSHGHCVGGALPAWSGGGVVATKQPQVNFYRPSCGQITVLNRRAGGPYEFGCQSVSAVRDRMSPISEFKQTPFQSTDDRRFSSSLAKENDHQGNTSSVPTLFEQTQLVGRNWLVQDLWLLRK